MTESTLMQDAETMVNTLKRLKATGIKLSIDDFGTGYSSLSYLKRFPLDALKIDRSFVHDITASEDAAAITSAIIAMARSLKLTVIAEGVETESQAALLRRQGCQFMQGYLFSRPVPATEGFQYCSKRRGTAVLTATLDPAKTLSLKCDRWRQDLNAFKKTASMPCNRQDLRIMPGLRHRPRYPVEAWRQRTRQATCCRWQTEGAAKLKDKWE